MKTKILLAGDSFGTQRVHHGIVDVPFERTWPEQVKRRFNDKLNICTDFKQFRRLVDSTTIIGEHTDASLIIVQAGIVDCFPRPLSHRLSTSNKLMHKIVRQLVRPVRREWINYANRTTFATSQELEKAITDIIIQQPKRRVGFITVTPQTGKPALTPGAQEAIFDFNDLLRRVCNKYDNAFLIDIHLVVLARGYKKFLHPSDAHLNQAGNDLLSDIVSSVITQELGNGEIKDEYKLVYRTF